MNFFQFIEDAAMSSATNKRHYSGHDEHGELDYDEVDEVSESMSNAKVSERVDEDEGEKEGEEEEGEEGVEKEDEEDGEVQEEKPKVLGIFLEVCMYVNETIQTYKSSNVWKHYHDEVEETTII